VNRFFKIKYQLSCRWLFAEENAPPVKAPFKDIDEGDYMRALGETGGCQKALFGHA
jgi:hypothetical protein